MLAAQGHSGERNSLENQETEASVKFCSQIQVPQVPVCPLLPSCLPEHLTVILCPDNANQPRPARSLSSISCPSFTPPKSETEQLKAECSYVRVIKEALNDHIPFSLLWAEESNSPAPKPGHRRDDQWNQLFDKRRGTQTRV